jgi:hypothetical protein
MDRVSELGKGDTALAAFLSWIMKGYPITQEEEQNYKAA